MREAARQLGYALAVHGSMAFDIDVVCVPWVDGAVSADDLIPALRKACSDVTGLPTLLACFPDIPSEWHLQDEEAISLGVPVFSEKPHGRRAYSWQLGGGAYVDCSVMPLK